MVCSLPTPDPRWHVACHNSTVPSAALYGCVCSHPSLSLFAVAAGALTATFVCPLDVLKTRLQVQRIASTKRIGIVGGLAGIVKTEGMRGLYRGLTPTLMALLPNWAVYFSVYGRLKTVLTTRQGGWAGHGVIGVCEYLVFASIWCSQVSVVCAVICFLAHLWQCAFPMCCKAANGRQHRRQL